jgi:hypothetical protein
MICNLMLIDVVSTARSIRLDGHALGISSKRDQFRSSNWKIRMDWALTMRSRMEQKEPLDFQLFISLLVSF